MRMCIRLDVGVLLLGMLALSGCVSRIIAEDTDGLLDDDEDMDTGEPVDEDDGDPTTGEPPLPECIDAVAEGAFPIRVAGTTVGATDNYLPMCASADGPDNTVSFVAPTAGQYEFSTEGSGFDTVLMVLDGGCDGAPLVCNDDAIGSASVGRVNLAAGQEVTAVIDGFGEQGDWSLTISQLDNGACPNEDLGQSAAPFSVFGVSTGQQNLFTGTCGGGAGPEYTYSWTPPESGVYTLDTLDASFDSVLYLLDGFCGGAEIGCNDDADVNAGGGLGSMLTAELVGGVPVTVVVDTIDSVGGEFTLIVSRASDTCGAEGNLFGAPVEIFDFLGPGSNLATSSCGGATADDRTYYWIPDDDGSYFAMATADFPAILSVTRDCVEVTCATAADQPRVSFDALAGQTYIIAVDAEAPASGEFSLTIEEARCPEFVLDSVPFLVVSGSTTDAGDSANPGCVNGGRDHTYSWTAPFSALYDFSLAGSSYDTALSIRDGSCTGPELACDDDGAGDVQSRITMRVAEGQTLTIIVDGFEGNTGDYTLEIAAI